MTPGARKPLVLAIDTSSTRQGAALADAGSVLSTRSLEAGESRAELLVACVRELLTDAGVAVEQLDALAVTRGPGSYTGLRVGLALVRGLALVDEIPVVGVGALELVAHAAPRGWDHLLAVLPAWREYCYVAQYEQGPQALLEAVAPQLVSASELGRLVARLGERWRPCAESSLVPDTKDRQRWLMVAPQRASVLARLAVQRARRGEAARAESILPTYVGPSGARPGRGRPTARGGEVSA